MAFPSSVAGEVSGAAVAEVDARWSMAYAAALNDLTPRYMDTRREGQLVAHPLFPVCFEWPLIVETAARLRGTDLTREEAARAVHASHDLILHRPIRPPERLSSHATVIGVEPKKAGAYLTMRVETVGDDGALVATSFYGIIYRGVGLNGPAHPPQGVPALPLSRRKPSAPRSETVIRIPGGMAHVYTECARIYNPIHTDARVAEAAGLPAIILHGTATLALAVSAVVASEAGEDPTRVSRVAGRFRAMVPMPSHITVRVFSRESADGADYVYFDVLNERGEAAVADGVIGLRV